MRDNSYEYRDQRDKRDKHDYLGTLRYLKGSIFHPTTVASGGRLLTKNTRHI